MKNLKQTTKYFTTFEIFLWGISVLSILISFLCFDRESYLTLCASLIGVSSLILCAKGNPVGQILMIIFSLLYGIISYTFAYYGEMITYVGMSMPMAVFALVSWLRHPYKGNKSEVEVNTINKKNIALMLISGGIVTLVFYFVLKHFGTANIVPSTISVTTSYIAVFLTFKRSPYYALAYAANDIVLIVLWILAGMKDIKYISVMVCFVAFLANDLYGFVNWRKMKKRQQKSDRI